MANEVQLRVNDSMRTVTAAPETPVAARADRRPGASGTALRVRVGAVVAAVRACRWPGSSVLHHAALKSGRQVGDNPRGAAACYAARKKLSRVPDLHPLQEALVGGAGGAVRVLLQRPDHQRRGIVVQDAATDRGADPYGDERSYLPVRYVSADHGRHSRAAKAMTTTNAASTTGRR